MMRHLIAAFTIGSLIAASPAAAQPSSCDVKTVSKSFQSRIAKIRKEARVYNGHEVAQREADKLRGKSDLNCLENIWLDVVVAEAKTRSRDMDEAIAASEFFLARPTLTDEGRRAELIRSILPRYRKTGNFAGILSLVASDYKGAPDALKYDMKLNEIYARIGTGEPDIAYRLARDLLTEKGNDAPRDLRKLAIGLADRQGDIDAMTSLEAIAAKEIGDLRWAGPVYGIEGDRLEQLFQRATNPLYRAELIKPPMPTYPDAAASRRLNGSCDVFFDVTADGKPKNVEAECTDRVFEKASTRAIKKVRLKPMIIDGEPRAMTGVEYPIEYTISR